MSVGVHYEVVYSGYPPHKPTDWSGEVFRVSRHARLPVGTITRSPSEEQLVKAAKDMAHADRYQRDRTVTLRLDLDDEARPTTGPGQRTFNSL